MKDLLDVITVSTDHELGFCAVPSGFTQYNPKSGKYYWNWEEDIAKPALEALGYSRVVFVNGERDSFGPLSRVVKAVDPGGKSVEFIYG